MREGIDGAPSRGVLVDTAVSILLGFFTIGLGMPQRTWSWTTETASVITQIVIHAIVPRFHFVQVQIRVQDQVLGALR